MAISTSQASKAPFVLRWGIHSCGPISHQMATDLSTPPSTRGVTDIVHKVVAVAGREATTAQSLVDTVWKGKADKEDIKVYGGYQALYDDPNVAIIFVASPPHLHFPHALNCIRSGKHVLVEKPFCVNGAQAKILAQEACAQGVFLMEGLWTRFLPIAYKIEEVVNSGVLGAVRSIQAEHGVDFHAEIQDPKHRMLRSDMAGGSLLDIGVYPWTWIRLLLSKPTATQEVLPVPKLVASMTRDPKSQVDDSSMAIIQFPATDGSGKTIQATLCANLTQHPKVAVTVRGSRGILEILESGSHAPAFRYEAWKDDESFGGNEASIKKEEFDFRKMPGGITGLAFEADDVARSIRDGKLESSRWPLSESILEMSVFDEMRRQTGLTYPAEVESTSHKL